MIMIMIMITITITINQALPCSELATTFANH